MGDNEKVQVALNVDVDGFVTQDCPACRKEFKVKYGEGIDKPVSFCPYCRHNERDCWWTAAQTVYFTLAVRNEIVDPRLEKMAKDFNKGMPRGGLVGMKMKHKPGPKAVAPEEPNGDWATATFECCGEAIKHDRGAKTLYCIICGSERRVARQ